MLINYIRCEKMMSFFGKYQRATSFFDDYVVKYERNMAPAHRMLRGDWMFWWIVIGFFTAFGMLCTVLTLYGAWLHRGCHGQGICLITPQCDGEEAWFYLWLKSMGILKCRIYTLESAEILEMLEQNGFEITSREQWPGQ